MMDMRPETAPRPATPGDYRDIAALWTKAFFESPSGGRDGPYEPAEAEASAAAGELFVISDVVEVASVVALLPGNCPAAAIAGDGEAEISRLAVARTFQRRGHARRLLDHCHSLARERGVEDIVLWSRPEQTAGHSLYRSLGYQRLPDRDRSNERGEQIVFGLRLG
jgi:ribosomal protein S18 acetylase RimI-like enzyme